MSVCASLRRQVHRHSKPMMSCATTAPAAKSKNFPCIGVVTRHASDCVAGEKLIRPRESPRSRTVDCMQARELHHKIPNHVPYANLLRFPSRLSPSLTQTVTNYDDLPTLRSSASMPCVPCSILDFDCQPFSTLNSLTRVDLQAAGAPFEAGHDVQGGLGAAADEERRRQRLRARQLAGLAVVDRVGCDQPRQQPRRRALYATCAVCFGSFEGCSSKCPQALCLWCESQLKRRHRGTYMMDSVFGPNIWLGLMLV